IGCPVGGLGLDASSLVFIVDAGGGVAAPGVSVLATVAGVQADVFHDEPAVSFRSGVAGGESYALPVVDGSQKRVLPRVVGDVIPFPADMGTVLAGLDTIACPTQDMADRSEEHT